MNEREGEASNVRRYVISLPSHPPLIGQQREVVCSRLGNLSNQIPERGRLVYHSFWSDATALLCRSPAYAWGSDGDSLDRENGQ